MNIKIIAVGSLKPAEKEITQRYADRIPWPLQILEIGEFGQHGRRERADRQAGAILSKLSAGSKFIALTAHGKPLSSRELAKTIEQYQRDAHKELAFVIGGAEGLGQAVLGRAELLLSFGPMTWPHMLARAMLMEQIYRASCILGNHPYHRGRD